MDHIFCTDCGSHNLKQLLEDVTCMDCGLEQRIGPEQVVSYDMETHMEEWCDQKPKKKDSEKKKRFDVISTMLDQPDNVIKTAMDLFASYEDKMGSICHKDVDSFAIVTIYYASRITCVPLLKRRVIESTGISKTDLTTICHLIETNMRCSSWSKLFNQSVHNNSMVTTINPILCVFHLSKEEQIVLRKKINNIINRIQNNPGIKDMQPTTIATGILYIAARSAKIEKITMSKVSKASGITLSSIINAEKEILKSLKAI